LQPLWNVGFFHESELQFNPCNALGERRDAGAQEAQQHFTGIWLPLLVAIALVTLSRAVAIYPLCASVSKTRLRVGFVHQHVLFWGGLRGALALALALALPEEMPNRDGVITVTSRL